MNTFNDRQSMVDVIAPLGYEGGRTNTSEAIRVAREEMLTAANGDRAGATFYPL